ncbi:uncharacterized protein LOC121420196 [Lytechinus variegatus]|uniref:uncharacterized protein LOC121420196 n=1 Tax=Lytechinus variegatus TaxID=7654 RepID=UPI001BB24925|nr:uncharacterized protein LOC121420196 [Lytechinus variegatus]
MEHTSTFAGEHTAIAPTSATKNTTSTTSTGTIVTSPNTPSSIVSDNDDQSDIRQETTLMSSDTETGNLHLEWNVSLMTPSAVQVECVCTADYSRQDGSSNPYYLQAVCSGDQINFGHAFRYLIQQSGCACPDAGFIESHCDPVIVTEVSAWTATLSWRQVEEATWEYSIFYTGPNGTKVTQCGGGATSIRLTDLYAASAYQIKVMAITTGGQSKLVGKTNFTTLAEGTLTHDGQGELCVMNVSSSIKVITNNDISECKCHRATDQYPCGNIMQDVCAKSLQNGFPVNSIWYKAIDLLNTIVCECRSSQLVEYCNVLQDMSEDPCERNPCLNGGSCADTDWCKCYYPDWFRDDCNVNPTSQSTKTEETTKANVHPRAPSNPPNNTENMAVIISSTTGSLSIMCVILVLCLHLYFKKRRRQDDRRAEKKIIERMSSAHFENPAYQMDKAAGDIVPPPIRPRPISSLPVGSGDLDGIYTEYIYVDQATPSPSERGSTAKDLLGNGEYIYVVEPFAQTHCGSDEGPLCPLPTAPPPPAGEYIYFDQGASPKTRSGTGNRYVLDPTEKKCPGKGEAPSAPSKLGSQMKPELPRSNIQPSPLKASADLSNIMSAGSDDVDSGNECIYEELPEMVEGEIVDIKTCPSMSVGSVKADVDGELYLLPCV